MMSYRGLWRVTAHSRDAAWNQRVTITGSASSDGSHELAVGTFIEVDGDEWNLTIQHNDGTGWADSLMRAQPMVENGARLSQLIESEDITVGGDQDYNDYVLKLDKAGPMFDVLYRPAALNTESLEMYPDGIFVGLHGMQYMAAEIRNTWGRPFHGDTVVDISRLGRQILRSGGIEVVDSWSAEDLQDTGQSLAAGVLELGPLEVGESRTVYFKVDATHGRQGTPAVQFHLFRAEGVPDTDVPMRLNERKILVAEISFDFSSNQAVARVPEGELRLELKSIIADVRGMEEVCRSLLKGRHRSEPGQPTFDELLARVRRGACDEATTTLLLRLVCACLEKDRRPPSCDGRFLWFPVEFVYTTEVGGFEGQFGPLPFQDPWWKAIVLAIVVIALLVAVIAALTGLGETGRPNERIGTVGAFSVGNVDAALIELDGSRTVRQSVADAMTGEPNQNVEVAVDAVIPIDPRVVPADATLIGHHVYKSGARTGLTHGIVTSVTAAINQCRGVWDDETNTCTADPTRPNLAMTNQIEIAQDPTIGEEPSARGDSGSVWLSDEDATRNQVVGLTHSGNDTSTANPIQDVLEALNVRLQA